MSTICLFILRLDALQIGSPQAVEVGVREGVPVLICGLVILFLGAQDWMLIEMLSEQPAPSFGRMGKDR